MTVQSAGTRNSYTASGGVAFAGTFLIQQSSDVNVYDNNALVASSAYTVTGVGAPAGFTVTFSVAPTSGHTIVLVSATSFTQNLDLVEGAGFYADSVEGALDRDVILSKQLKEITDRAPKFDIYACDSGIALDSVVGQAGKVASVSTGETRIGWVSLSQAQAAATGSYVATGSGAVSRTVSSKLSDFPTVSVKDFGAVGNGVADDTTAIKNAIASITTVFDGTGAKGVVLFPTGTYVITAVVEVPPGIILMGEARFSTNLSGSTIYKNFDGVAFRFVRRNAAPGSLFHLGGMIDLSMTGNGAVDTVASKLVELGDSTSVTTSTGAWNVWITRCHFNNSSGYGVYSAHSQEALIDANMFRSVKFPIYYNTLPASARITRNTFLDESLIANAIAMQFRPGTLGGAAHLMIDKNYCIGFRYGLFITSVVGAVVRDNAFEGVTKSPIVLDRRLSDFATQDGNGCLAFHLDGNTFINWASDATDNPAVQINYSRQGYVGVQAYQSPNGAATNCITFSDDTTDHSSDSVIIEPIRSGTGTAVSLSFSSAVALQNTILGRAHASVFTCAVTLPALTVLAGTPLANTAYAQSIVKGWVVFDGSATNPITPVQSYNITAPIWKNAAGNYTITWDRDFTCSRYVITGMAKRDDAGTVGANIELFACATAMTVGEVHIVTTNAGGALVDCNIVCVAAFGPQ